MRVGFVVSREGVVAPLNVSHGVDAAYDILTDAGYSPEKAAQVAVGAERNGHNPEQIARKMVRLGKALGKP